MFDRFDSSWSYSSDEYYPKFLSWILDNSIEELGPGASMARILTALKILKFTTKFKNSECKQRRNQLLSGARGKRLHCLMQEQLKNSFPDVNILAFEILIEIQNINQKGPVTLICDKQQHQGYISKVIDQLRTSCTIATSTGLALELGYAIHLEAAINQINLAKLCSNTVLEIIDLGPS